MQMSRRRFYGGPPAASPAGPRSAAMKIYLETPRLVLREFTEHDADDLFALDADPEVMRYIGPYRLADVDAYREYIRTRFLSYYSPQSPYGFWAAAEKPGGAFLGWFTLRPALHY